MNLDGQPTAASGRDETAIPQESALGTPSQPFRPGLGVLLAFEGLFLLPAIVGVVVGAAPARDKIKADEAQAERRVIEIVNQPVSRLPRTAEAEVFSPGWFHPGAVKPDFATADVRRTQNLLYDRYGYVTSDLNPSDMFRGHDVEFNAMTKYFYVDRTTPKKRLSEAEMLEINRLYRGIAQAQQALTGWWLTVGGLLGTVLLLATAPLLVLRRKVLSSLW